MGVFSRFKDIVNSNINDMLDKVEEPEKMSRLMIQEMEDTLIELKSSCAGKMASVKQLDREKKLIDVKISQWEKRARMALEHGKEDLAREALLEKKRFTNEAEIIDNDLTHLKSIVEESRENILRLEEKLEEVRTKHKILIQRGIHAKETKKARAAMDQANGMDAFSRFEQMERRVEKMEAEASLYGNSQFSNKSSTEQAFQDLESSKEIDSELEALKESMASKDE